MNETEKLYYIEIIKEIKIYKSNIFEKKVLCISEEDLLIFVLIVNLIIYKKSVKKKIYKLIFYTNFKSLYYIKRFNYNNKKNFKIKNNKIDKFI